MTDLKPSDVEGIVQQLEAVAMSKANIPADATAMQKYTALFTPISGDEALNHSETQWYLGSCLVRAVAEITAGNDLQEYPKEITDNIRQFAQMVNEPVARLRLLYSVYDAFKDPAARVPDLTWDHHRLVYMRVKDPAQRLPLLQQAAQQNLTVGDLQKQINKAQKSNVDERTVLVNKVKRSQAQLARSQAALNRFDQQHGATPPAPVTPAPVTPSPAKAAGKAA